MLFIYIIFQPIKPRSFLSLKGESGLKPESFHKDVLDLRVLFFPWNEGKLNLSLKNVSLAKKWFSESMSFL